MKYEIRDQDGATINTVVAEIEWLESNYPGCDYIPLPDDVLPPTQLQRVFAHREFRKLLTLGEQLLVDNFDVPEFAAEHPKIAALTVFEKAQVRTALATYRESQEINLDDPDTATFVGLFGALGLWDNETRAASILTGSLST